MDGTVKRSATRPLQHNTRKRPEAFHAICLKDEADMLLEKILQLAALHPQRMNQLYPKPRHRSRA